MESQAGQIQAANTMISSSSLKKSYTKEELAQRISELASPAEISEFYFNLQANRDQLQVDENQLRVDEDQLRVDEDQLRVDRDQLRVDRDQLRVDRDQLRVDRDQLRVDKDQFRFNKDQIQAENSLLRTNMTVMESRNIILSEGSPCRTFTCFSKLPPELRFRIWRLATPEARLIEVKIAPKEDEEGKAQLEFACPQNHHPSILHVCKEARDEILRIHPLCPESLEFPNEDRYSGGIPRFINHAHDVLCIEPIVFDKVFGKDLDAEGTKDFTPGALETWTSQSGSGEFMHPAGFNPFKIRRIAIRTQTWEIASLIFIYKLINFPMLEELIIVNEAYPRRYGMCKMVDLNPLDEIFYPQEVHEAFPAGMNDMVEFQYCAREYQEEAEEAFTEEMDLELFEIQWGKAFFDSGLPNTDGVGNPWLAAKRTPPSIRMMRMVIDKESTLVADYGQKGREILDYEDGTFWPMY